MEDWFYLKRLPISKRKRLKVAVHYSLSTQLNISSISGNLLIPQRQELLAQGGIRHQLQPAWIIYLKSLHR